MPVWVRVPGTIALVLVGVVASTMLLTAMGAGGGAGRHGPAPEQNQEQVNPSESGGH
jgi:hypothetical protein